MTEIVEIKAATEQALGAMKELVTKQDAEIKSFGEASKETAAAIKKMDASFVQMAADHAGAMTRLSAMEAKGNSGGKHTRTAPRPASQRRVPSL